MRNCAQSTFHEGKKSFLAFVEMSLGPTFVRWRSAIIIEMILKEVLHAVCYRLYLTRKLSLSWVDDSESETTSNAERKSIAKDINLDFRDIDI